MLEIIRESYHIARKEYCCSAWEWLKNSDFDPGEFSFSELREIAKMKKRKGKILPGERYLRQFARYDGEIWEAKINPDIHRICIDHNVYED